MVCELHEWIKNPNPKGLEDVWICKNCGRDRLFSAGFAKAPKDLTQTVSFDTKVNARQVIQRIGEDLYKSVGSAVRELYVNALSHGCLPILQLLKQQEGFDYDKCKELPKVEVTLDPQTRKLIIHDINGVGMTKYVIDSALSSVGDSDNVDRTRGGMFGMGVFAFMKLSETLLIDTWAREDNERFAMTCRGGLKWDIELDQNGNPVIPDMHSAQLDENDPNRISTYGTKLTMTLKDKVNMRDIVDTIEAVGKYWPIMTTLYVVNELNKKIDVAESDSESFLSKIKQKDIVEKRYEWMDDDEEEEHFATPETLVVREGFTAIGRSELRSDLIKAFDNGEKWSKEAMDEACAWVTFDNEDYTFHGAIFKTIDTNRHLRNAKNALLVNVPIAVTDDATRYIPDGITGWIINIKDEGKYRPVGSRDQLNDESCIKLGERLRKDFKALYKEITEIVTKERDKSSTFTDTNGYSENWMLNAVKALHAEQKNLHKFIEIGESYCGNRGDDYSSTTEKIYFKDSLEHIAKALHVPVRVFWNTGHYQHDGGSLETQSFDTILSSALFNTDNIFKQSNNNPEQRLRIVNHIQTDEGTITSKDGRDPNSILHSIATEGGSVFIVKRKPDDEQLANWNEFGLANCTDYIKQNKLGKIKTSKKNIGIPHEIVCWRFGYGNSNFEHIKFETDDMKDCPTLVRLTTGTKRLQEIGRQMKQYVSDSGAKWIFTKSSKKLDDYMEGTISEKEWLERIGKRKVWLKSGRKNIVQTDIASFKETYKKVFGDEAPSPVHCPEDRWDSTRTQECRVLTWNDAALFKNIRQMINDEKYVTDNYDYWDDDDSGWEYLVRNGHKDITPGNYETPELVANRLGTTAESSQKYIICSDSELIDLCLYWNISADTGMFDMSFYVSTNQVFPLIERIDETYHRSGRYAFELMLNRHPDFQDIVRNMAQDPPSDIDGLVDDAFDKTFEIIEKFQNYKLISSDKWESDFNELLAIQKRLRESGLSLYNTEGSDEESDVLLATLLGISLDNTDESTDDYYTKFLRMIKPITDLVNSSSWSLPKEWDKDEAQVILDVRDKMFNMTHQSGSDGRFWNRLLTKSHLKNSEHDSAINDIKTFIESLLINDNDSASKFLNGITKNDLDTLRATGIESYDDCTNIEFEYVTKLKCKIGEWDLFQDKNTSTYKINSVEPGAGRMLFRGTYTINK